ncbi:DUF3732 domain-containing protein [Streptomyces montanisoli]|uniref:DUF3732 domain-containing protein n=1 Tax=Streptomyces montanisoli TaxID=2798581 RepID=A0A940RW75_9ACTN|nr:DUF3732 domain-containing protein [Streptomyces montanisoli]MBP0458991.1 DUF3732 domain-containing protein [Streptomyces montanisoli]
MTFQIQAVTIYGKQPGQIRTVPFRPGELNIVTGDSRRGKSALLTIIDYCLASGGYPVKAGRVRDYVSAYAVTLVRSGQQLFVARRAPAGKAASSTVLCVLAQAHGTPPPPLESLTFATPLDAAKDRISDFCGIDRTVRVPAVGNARTIAPSIRHALFFCFQAQNEVANQDLLFHSQGEEWRPNTIRGVLPYFLGAVDVEQALRRNRLRILRRDLADLEAALAPARQLDPAAGQALALVTEAVEAGLLASPSEGRQEPQADEVLGLLRQALDHNSPVAAGDDAEDPLGVLTARRGELRRLHGQTRVKITDLKRAVAENTAFTTQATEQRARLVSLGLLRLDPETSQASHCPVCDSALDSANETVTALTGDLAHLEGDLEVIGSDTPALQRLLGQEEERLQQLRSALARNQEEINEVSAGLRALHREPDAIRRAALVQGRISLYLDSTAQRTVLPQIEDRREELRGQIAHLEELLSDDIQGERLASYLSLISQKITAKAKALGLEHSENPVRLDANRLTVIADKPDGPLPLREMGSGENHLGYHVAALLSLHEWFTEHHAPVPRLLVLDQPSQVYFPRDHTDDAVLGEDDRNRLLNVFRAFHDTLRLLDGQFQIIVMEHADLADDAFAPYVRERWRNDLNEALVPADWIDEADDTAAQDD